MAPSVVVVLIGTAPRAVSETVAAVHRELSSVPDVGQVCFVVEGAAYAAVSVLSGSSEAYTGNNPRRVCADSPSTPPWASDISLEARNAVARSAFRSLDTTDVASICEADTWVLFLNAGCVLGEGFFVELESLSVDELARCPVAVRETGYKYRLSRALPKGHYLANARVLRGDRSWLGSPGTVLCGSLLKKIGSLADVPALFLLRYVFISAVTTVGSFAALTSVAVDSPGRHEDDPVAGGQAFLKGWYLEFNSIWERLLVAAAGAFAEHYDPDADGRCSQTLGVPEVLQWAYLFDLQARLLANAGALDLQVLSDHEASTFWADTAGNLQRLSPSTIVGSAAPAGFVLGFGPRVRLLEVRDGRLSYEYLEDDINVVSSGCVPWKASRSVVNIQAMRYDAQSDVLKITGYATFPGEPTTRLILRCGDDVIPLPETGHYSGTEFFGSMFYHPRSFSAEIRLASDTNQHLVFVLEDPVHDTSVPIKVQFVRPRSRLSRFPGAYWAAGRHKITAGERDLVVEPMTAIGHVKSEVGFLRKLATSGKRALQKAALLRTAYWVTKPLYGAKGPIWFFFDKLYKAGDNGEYLYRHALAQSDGIRKYFLLDQGCDDACRFKALRLPFSATKALKSRLAFLNADLVFATHIGIPAVGGFGSRIEKYFRDLFDYDVFCIQHGLTVQRLAAWQNQVRDDTTLYGVASPFETANLEQHIYGYDPAQIIPTGLARFDGLVNADQKQLLIAPSWRNYIAPPGVAFRQRDYAEGFRRTDYFKLYNALINDERLIEGAQRYGYGIVFLPHPIVHSQMGDWERNTFVQIVDPLGSDAYKTMLTESSLMVTDYSGIQFDFAYMYKPVVYYHPPQLPPSYDEAVYKYGDNGLGEVVTESDQLVQTLVGYMADGCQIKPEYRQRIDQFFYFHDRSNSKRIYDTALRWAEGRQAHSEAVPK